MDLGIPGLEDATPIGQGGFATVYRARQRAFARTVAVKVLTGTNLDEDSQLRFTRELQALGLLSGHPGIVTVYETGFTNDGRPYLTMAYVAEGTLADRLQRDGPVPWPEAVEILISLSGALETAHQSGILHRDIKPANVLLSKYGAQLSDFGIARIAGTGETQSGVVTASLSHAPPEVLDGQRPTVSADIYSLGSTAAALFLGRSPFERTGDETFLSIIRRIHTDAPPDLRAYGAPDDLAALIARMLAKDPADRPRSAMQVGQELQGVLRSHGLAVPQLLLASGLEVDPRDDAGNPTTPDQPAPDNGQAAASPISDQGEATHANGVVPVAPVAAAAPGAPGTPSSRSRPARTAVIGAAVVAGLLAVGLAGVGLTNRNGGGGASPTVASQPLTDTAPLIVPLDTEVVATTPATEVAPLDTELPDVTSTPATTSAPATSTTLAPVSDDPVCGVGDGFLPDSGEPVRIIVDTGVGVGIDDLGALGVLHALADAGDAEVLAAMVSVGGDADAGPTVDAVNTYFGRPDIPIGIVSGPAPSEESRYTAQLAADFPNDLGDAAPAVDLYRRVLADQPDDSVTIVSTGFLTNLADLLASPADEISELTGEQLVAAKVRRWVAMGGGYPDSAVSPGGPEFNFANDVTAVQRAVSGWPTPAVFSGFEVGAPIMTGAVLQTETPPENPIREGYRLYGGLDNQSSFDLTAILAAVRGTSDGVFELCRGVNVVGADGSTTWEHRSNGPHGYLRTVAPEEEIASTLDALLITPPT